MMTLVDIYQKLYDAYGPQAWWPAETQLEMMIGAILVQNTAWTNVEKAIEQLMPYMEYQTLHAMPIEDLQEYIRPAGFFKAKSQTIKALLAYLETHNFNLEAMPLDGLRDDLLNIKGIGPETADSILLYTFDQPIFVVDTYLKRMLKHLGYPQYKTYDAYQKFMMQHIPEDTYVYQEFHALIVEYGKRKKHDFDPLESFLHPVFPYTNAELATTIQGNPKFNDLVVRYGRVERAVMLHPFDAIVYTIIGQLVSVKAAASIQARFDAKYPNPLDVVHDDIETVKSVGLTLNKAKAIHRIANDVVSGVLDLYALDALHDDALVRALVKLPGIGDWSARIIMMHGYHRKNLSSYDDIALRRGVATLHQVESITRESFDAIMEDYAPYKTIASIYYWRYSKDV